MKWWRLGIGLILLTMLFALSQLPDGKLHLIFCDVGQGDAALVILDDFQMLIDTGPKDGGAMECLSKHIPFWDRRLELVVNTHPQADHFGDIVAVISHYQIGQMVLSDEEPLGQKAKEAYEMIKSDKIKQVIARKGDRFRYGELYFDVLSPIENTGDQVLGKASDENERALVLDLKYPGFSALFTSDIGQEQESALGDEGILSPVEVLKVAHHGSKYSSSSAFDEKIRPKWAVISVGKNSYGHPTSEALERLGAVGARIWRTDRQGEAEFVADGQSYRLNMYH